MKGEVNLDERKLSPTDKAQLKEIKELYTEGAEYFKESSSYMLWHLAFYAAALGCLIANLYLPSSFAMVVAIFALVQHIRYRGKAKKIAIQIMKLENEIFGRAIHEAIKAFKEYMENDKATKPRVTRKRRTTNSNNGDSTGSIRVREHGEVTEPDNPGWYKPESKKQQRNRLPFRRDK